MEIRAVEGRGGHEARGFVVEMLGEVDFRSERHEACERAMAVLERDVDRLQHDVGVLKQQVLLLLTKLGLDQALPHGLPPDVPMAGSAPADV